MATTAQLRARDQEIGRAAFRGRETVMALLRSGRSFGEAALRADLPLDDVIALWRSQRQEARGENVSDLT